MARRIIHHMSIVLLSIVSMSAGAADTAQAKVSSSPSPEVMKLLQQGSRYYLQHQFSEAIGPYAKALALEKKQATLDTKLWRVLVDNLGMAYGITGDLERAKATFEYALTKDGAYPMFYYNLACTYAEMNDLEQTISNLRLAFQYRGNLMAGEEFPNPAEDSSFQRFLKDARFIALLRELGAGR
jgi:tetratricopeptide (TPR) repeat protein